MPRHILLLLISVALWSESKAVMHTIQASDFVYTPDNLTITRGDTVRFEWVEGSHPTSSLSGAWTTFPLNFSNTSFDLVLADTGFYPYQCDFHFALGMIGSVTVEALPQDCSSLDPPEGLSNTVNFDAGTLNFAWNPVGNALGYQIQGGIVGGGSGKSPNLLGEFTNSWTIPLSSVPAGATISWKIRAACGPSGPPLTAFSTDATYTLPNLRNSAFSASPEEWLIRQSGDNLYIELKSRSDAFVDIVLIDLMGRRLLSKNLRGVDGILPIELDISNLSSTYYIIQCRSENTFMSQQIFIN